MKTITNARPGNARGLMLAACVAASVLCLSTAASAQDAWDHTDAPRFQLLAPLAGQAVLDRETGILWERSPSGAGFTWATAQDRCNKLVVGNRMGWRLPTLQELTSILSVGAAPNNLEANNPFVAPPTLGQAIWSGTTSAANTANAWAMHLPGGVGVFPKGVLARCWCVRFRQGVDPQ